MPHKKIAKEEHKKNNDNKQTKNVCFFIQQGAPCPKCGKGKLEYNGMLNLACPICGYENVGGFT